MAGSLKRVLRIRALQEEIGRRRLEAEAAGLREIERSAELAVREAHISREASFAALERGQRNGDPRSEQLSWERAVREGERTEALRPLRQAGVERAREEFLAARSDRWQVERLVEAAAERTRQEEGKRFQRQMDDWFQGRPLGKAGRKKKSN